MKNHRNLPLKYQGLPMTVFNVLIEINHIAQPPKEKTEGTHG